jgi:hypothetical protein
MLMVVKDADRGQGEEALELFELPLDELARQGAQRMIAAALDAEVEA